MFILLHQEILILQIFPNFLQIDYFTPKYNILLLIQSGNIYYRLLYIMN